jgi:hypothetical protein
MIPYQAYIKQSQEPARPKYTSATETGFLKPYKAPQYYTRPGMDPRLAAQGKTIEEEYGRMFPYGDYTYSSKGWGHRPVNQEQIDVRNRFKFYEAQAMGAMPSNPQLTQQSPSAAQAFIGDLARSPVIPLTALPMYAYDIYTKGLQQANQDTAKSNTVYADMLADAGKRVANRFGGNFELNYPNDTVLDYSSYALEAGMGGITGGGSTLPAIATRYMVPRVAARLAPSILTRGFQPVAQGSSNVFARWAGNYTPVMLNYGVSSLNPVPILTGAARATGLAAIPAQLASHFVTREAANNYRNAVTDTNAFNAANPNAGPLQIGSRFANSLLAGGASIDPTVFNRYGLGAGAVAPAFEQQVKKTIDERVNNFISRLPPDQKDSFMSNPHEYEALRRLVSEEYTKSNPIYPFVQAASRGSTFNPFKFLGATTYSEDLERGRNNATNVASSVLNLPPIALQDRNFYNDLQSLQQMVIKNPQDIGGSQLGKRLMNSPLADLVDHNPKDLVTATVMMTNLNDTLYRMYQTYQQTGEVPPGYKELVEHANNLAQVQKMPANRQESGNTPFVDALIQLQSTMQDIYATMQPVQAGVPE